MEYVTASITGMDVTKSHWIVMEEYSKQIKKIPLHSPFYKFNSANVVVGTKIMFLLEEDGRINYSTIEILSTPESSKSRFVFILLSLFLGGLGVNNLYIRDYSKFKLKIFIQLGLGGFTIPLLMLGSSGISILVVLMTCWFIFLLSEILYTTKDALGYKLS